MNIGKMLQKSLISLLIVAKAKMNRLYQLINREKIYTVAQVIM